MVLVQLYLCHHLSVGIQGGLSGGGNHSADTSGLCKGVEGTLCDMLLICHGGSDGAFL